MSAINQRQLLLLAALLAALRFVLVPWLDNLDALSNELAQERRRQIKAEQLLAKGDRLAAERQHVSEQLAQALAIYPPLAAGDDLAVSVQKQLQQQITERGLSLELFNWLGHEQLTDAGLWRGQLQLRLSGEAAALARWLAEVQQRPHLHVQGMTGSWSGALTPTTAVTLELVIESYLQVGEGGA